MSELNPYAQLGVTEDASFEEIQQAKGRLMAEFSGDRQILESIEAAYDAVLMDRLRLRQEGKIKVPDRIRFPEQAVQTVAKPLVASEQKTPEWLRQLVDHPTRQDILITTGVFLPMVVVSVLPINPNLLQLLMALGVGASLYFLNRKENKFGRAVLLSLGGLVVGLVLGSILGALLPVSMLYLNEVSFAAVITLIVVWLITTFLK